MSELSPEAINLMNQHTDKWIAERVCELEAEKEELSIRYNHACDRIDRDIRGKQLEADVDKWKSEANRLYGVGQDIEADRVALQKQLEELKGFVDMFDIDRLNGMFNHYMGMQKQAIHGQSGSAVIKFWHERTKTQQGIIDAFKALEAGGE